MDIREDYIKYLRGELDPFIFERKMFSLTGREFPLNKEKEVTENVDEQILNILDEEF